MMNIVSKYPKQQKISYSTKIKYPIRQRCAILTINTFFIILNCPHVDFLSYFMCEIHREYPIKTYKI